MNFLEQFAILCATLFVGSILKAIIPLAIPETIYGMLLLFLLFVFKIIKTADVRRASDTILENMSFLFVPIGVGIIENYADFRENFIAIFFITLISSIIAMVITMNSVKFIQKRRQNV